MPVIDARKSEVFCRLYAPDGSPRTPSMNLKPEAIGELVQEETLFVGNGVRLYREVLSRTLGQRFREGPEHLWYPRASVLARSALSQVSRGAIEPAQPLYVRPSDAALTLEKMKLKA
jgi:tRNA A37 threonylcarbamoyladenosine modification protein TsaB